MDSLGIDMGLATLIATSDGTMFGVGLIAELKRFDKQIIGIARHRARSGAKSRQPEIPQTGGAGARDAEDPHQRC